MVLFKEHYYLNPFGKGGAFAGAHAHVHVLARDALVRRAYASIDWLEKTEWRWTHPHLCCGKADSATLDGLYVFSKSCTKSAKDVGLYGECGSRSVALRSARVPGHWQDF